MVQKNDFWLHVSKKKYPVQQQKCTFLDTKKTNPDYQVITKTVIILLYLRNDAK